MSFRINIPFLFHFQTWREDRPQGMPFVSQERERGVVYLGGRMFQLTGSDGNFFLCETSFIRFQLGQVGVDRPA
jgi:hypothetical protein